MELVSILLVPYAIYFVVIGPHPDSNRVPPGDTDVLQDWIQSSSES
jgi:hypothetical protein